MILTQFGPSTINKKGYPRLHGGKLRNTYLHRASWELAARTRVPEGFQVHHMAGKLCWCPESLVALGPGLHVHRSLRDPYTGEFLTVDAWRRRYGSDI